jgi:hypothetical protein
MPAGEEPAFNGQYCDDHVRQRALHDDRPEFHRTAPDSKEAGNEAVLTATSRI